MFTFAMLLLRLAIGVSAENISDSTPTEKAISQLKKAGAFIGYEHRDGTLIPYSLEFDRKKAPKFRDKDLKPVGAIQSLTTLRLGYTGISDSGLKVLVRLQHLYFLELAVTAVSDKGMASVGKCKNLRILNLNCTKVSDKGLALLAPLAKLEYLSLVDTRITGAGWKNFAAAHKEISSLSLANCAITDSALKEIGQLHKLDHLVLDGTKITNKGLNHLLRLKKLTSITISNTAITDEGIITLSKIRSLTSVLADECKIRRGTLERLKQSHPHLSIQN